MGRRLLVLVVLALVSGPVACNGILGNRDAVADDESTTDQDGSVDAPTSGALPDAATGDAFVQDGSTPDGSYDASPIPADAPYEPLAFDPAGPTDLAVDNGNVYWIDPTRVQGCPKTGCTGAPTQYGTGTGLTAVAANASWLYWADSAGSVPDAGSVSFCAPSTCAPTTMGSLTGPLHLALSPTTAFWTEPSVLGSCPLGQGCATPASFEVYSAGPLAWGPLNGGSLYFIQSGALWFCPVSKCPPTTSDSLNNFAAVPFDVVASATGVPICLTVPAPYGEIFCTFDLATPKSIATSPSPRSIALDKTYVYWVDDVDLALERCAFNSACGAKHEVLAYFPDLPGPFVVDGAKIYGIVLGPAGFVYVMPTP